MYGLIRGVTDCDIPGMAELAGQSLALAEESGDPALYMALAGGSYTKFLTGELRGAIAILDRAMELVEGDLTLGAGVTVGCPFGYCLIFKGGMLTTLGELQEAGELIERGTELCSEQGDLESAGWGHMWSFWHAYYSGDYDPAVRNAQQALEIAERLGDSFSRTWAWTLFGGAELLEGRWTEAIEALERALSMSRELRTAVEGNSWVLGWLAEAYLGRGDRKRALELAEEGLAAADSAGLPNSEIFAGLILGRVLLASNDAATVGEIEHVLNQALEQAVEIENRSLAPLIHVELAALACLREDREDQERELREAHRLFTESGATVHAERLAGELGTLAG
jgi:tetratricopeptide (TPR) repeat protein